jgi:hypothetical protein
MSRKVLKFTSSEAEYPSDRIAAFIALAREIKALVPNGDWDPDNLL